jgi:hypothetical protein
MDVKENLNKLPCIFMVVWLYSHCLSVDIRYLCIDDLHGPVMFLMRADLLLGPVGGGWAVEIESFSGPVKWHRPPGVN